MAPIDKFENNLLRFENSILALFGPFYESIDELDELISKEDPEIEDLDAALSFSKKSQNRYFFRNLKSPEWLDLLIEKGFFDEIPGRGDYCIEIEYLLKVVEEKPEKVKTIIEYWSETEHLGVQVDFMKMIRKLTFTFPLNRFVNLSFSWVCSFRRSSGFLATSV